MVLLIRLCERHMKTKQITIGIILALVTACISGASNFIGKISVTAVKDPILFTTLKNALVAIFLLLALTALGKWKSLRTLSKGDWAKLMLIGVVGGSIPFALFFTGLSLTSAVAASFIHKTLFVWVLFLAIPFLTERLRPLQWSAMLLLLFGTFALGGFQQLKFGAGEAMILAATLLWAIENIIAKKALRNIATSVVVTARMALGSVLLFAYVFVTGKAQTIPTLSVTQWLWTAIPALLLFGYVVTWYAALKRLPASVTASLLVPATIITALLSAGFGKSAFVPSQALALAVFAFGCACTVIPLVRKFSARYARSDA